MNRKASIVDIMVWLVVAFVVVVFFAMWIYGFNQLTEVLSSIPNTPGLNISGAINSTIIKIEEPQATGLHTLAYVIILMLAISILLTNFLEKVNPAFFVVYLMVVVGSIIASAYVSNQYEDLLGNAIIGTTLGEFTGGTFILLNLPIFVTVIGMFGAIFLFAGIMRDRGLGESVS